MNGLVESFNKISAPQRVLVFLLMMIGLLVGFYMLLFTGLEDDIQGQRDRRVKLLAKETDIKRKVANKEEIMSELDDLKKRKEKVDKVLPQKAEIPRLLLNIQGQAKIVGLDIRRFELGNEAPQALYTEIPVSMELLGTYDQVANFFYYVGRMERIVNIKNISIERKSGGSYGKGDLRVVCEAITYRGGGSQVPGK